MELVKNYLIDELINILIGRTVHFKSDCEFFPNFDVTGKVLSYKLYNNELLFKIKLPNGKLIDVGSNMKKLSFEII